MKLGELKSIGHNISDSLGSGIGLLIGHYETDIFAEAANSPEGYITVDFLNGTTSGGRPSPSLAEAISLYSQALDDLCRRHSATSETFNELKTRFTFGPYGRKFVVTVSDCNGRSSTDEYLGLPGRRVMELDELGRMRPTKANQTSKPD